MTKNQARLRELLDRQSRERGRMAEIAGLDADKITDEIREEEARIGSGTADLELQIRAARTAVEADEEASIVNGTEGDPEKREIVELRSRAVLGKYLNAAIRGHLLDGAESELNAALGLTEGPATSIPFALWEPKPEKRADVATGTPGSTGVNLQPIQPALFARAVLPRLGVAMPSAETGSYASATISTSLTAAAKNKGHAQQSTAAALEVTTDTPKRISARLSLRIEDLAAVGQMNFEAALRENLSMALSAELDDQGLNGNGTAPNLSGIRTRLESYANTAGNVKETFQTFIQHVASLIDGNWAESMMDISLLLGPKSMENAVATFATNDDSVSVYKSLKDQLAGLFTSSRMPDPTNSNVQDAIAVRRAHAATIAVCPMWGSIQIDDIYSGSASGTRHVSMHVLCGDVILVQPEAWRKLRFKTS